MTIFAVPPVGSADLKPLRQQDGDVGNDSFQFDGVSWCFLGVHLAVIVYVASGWLMPSRTALYIYLLVLPVIVMQWIFNGGASIVNNFENLTRGGRWRDGRNRFEGAFFRTFLTRLGVYATTGQITTVLCAAMLIFWVTAFFRMILIVVPPPV